MTTGANDTRPTASVVIRCYNEAAHIGRVFEALKRQAFRDFEVIVIDSGSDDGTLDIVAGHDATVVHIRKEDFSFGRSLNLGCGAARGEYLVFLSAHCYPVDDQWLANLITGFDDPQVAAVYGKQRGVDSSHFSEQQIFRRWYPEESIDRQDGPFCNNANCAVRRALWEQFPYDEELTGLEDVAWASSVTRHGWWIGYRADAAVLHVHSESPSQIRNRYQREAITFQKVFPREHFNLWDFLRLTSRNLRADWGAARREGVVAKEWWNILRFRVAQFAGTYQGFHTRRPSSSELKRRFYYPEAD
ncbi:MAG: glycosyltransferase family A protein [Acidimicrobiia bacterium]|nr:glycosyltransferase family A protein [Acidimicrobiia bacterium]